MKISKTQKITPRKTKGTTYLFVTLSKLCSFILSTTLACSPHGFTNLEFRIHNFFYKLRKLDQCKQVYLSKKMLTMLPIICLIMYLFTRCPVRCLDWSCSQPTCSKYHGESYDSLYFFQIDATFFCRSLKILT